MELVATVRVIFGDTDAMGIVYNGNYLRWFETGRAELMRSRGIAYRDMTEADLHLPLIESHLYYRSPARYDDLVNIRAEIREFRGVRLTFGYRVESAAGTLLVEGSTVHAFTDGAGKVVRPPEGIRSVLSKIANG
jgi:acyl-CoA thioester hydrolase